MTESPTLPRQSELAAGAFYLRQLAELLRGLDDDAYVRSVEAVGGSIGGHTRHILEHYLSILAARESGRLCFEDRPREPVLQARRAEARAAIGRLQAAILDWDLAGDGALDLPVKAATTLSGDLKDARPLDSTFRREWNYVVLHAVHHLALVAVAARLQGIAVDPAFGRAPATLHYEGRPVDFRGH